MFATQELFAPSLCLPPAGPNAKPQQVEIAVAPWQRVAVLFRAAHVAKSEESGSVWYWRPERVIPLVA
jgi:hypothetical protein